MQHSQKASFKAALVIVFGFDLLFLSFESIKVNRKVCTIRRSLDIDFSFIRGSQVDLNLTSQVDFFLHMISTSSLKRTAHEDHMQAFKLCKIDFLQKPDG